MSEELLLTLNEAWLSRLDTITRKLGMASEQMWGALLKEARVEGILDLGLALLSLAGCALFLKLAIRSEKEGEDGALIFCVVAILVGLVASTDLFYRATCDLINPEYWALKTLLEAAK